MGLFLLLLYFLGSCLLGHHHLWEKEQQERGTRTESGHPSAAVFMLIFLSSFFWTLFSMRLESNAHYKTMNSNTFHDLSASPQVKRGRAIIPMDGQKEEKGEDGSGHGYL